MAQQLSLFQSTSVSADLPEALQPGQNTNPTLYVRLRKALGGNLGDLVLTHNKTRILSARPRANSSVLDVRIHRCFSDASDQTLAAVARFLQANKGSNRRRRALEEIREHFSRHAPARSPRGRSLTLQPLGRHRDLRVLRDRICEEYFGRQLAVAITWGKAHSPRPRRGKTISIRLGSYSEREQLIRIHRCLDSPEVPEYVVESVVYHEMLHADLPVEIHNGRRRLHTPEFRRRERLFRRFDEAERWLAQHLTTLATRC